MRLFDKVLSAWELFREVLMEQFQNQSVVQDGANLDKIQSPGSRA